ncbi:putative nucleotidyltransferase [Bacillus atrophaeus]|nr:hypothetical protein [Bacillus atrophaeus]MDQ0926459.1 putative nucleotidyltransferase [Bacillus atrophaeus]
MNMIKEILNNKDIVLNHIKNLDVKSYFVYIAGSLVEGFGNGNSDIDVYVIYDSDKGFNIEQNGSNEVLFKTELSYVNNIIYDGKRFDFEYWNINDVQAIINKVNSIDPNSEQYLIRLNKDETDFLHRFKVSQCIYNDELYSKYKQQISFEKLQFIQIVLHSEQYDGYIEDLQGAFSSGDLETSYLISHLLIETALASFLCSHGETNPSRKWLLRKLGKYENETLNSNLKNLYFDLLSFRFNPSNIENHIEKTIEFTTELNLEAQDYLKRMQNIEV